MHFTTVAATTLVSALGYDVAKELLKEWLMEGARAIKKRLTKSDIAEIEEKVEELVKPATWEETQRYTRLPDMHKVRRLMRDSCDELVPRREKVMILRETKSGVRLKGTKKAIKKAAPKRATKKALRKSPAKKAAYKAAKKTTKKATRKAAKKSAKR